MEVEARRERRRRQRERVVGCCKSAIAFIFSHIGLSATVAAYALAGGFLFQLIEGPHELWEMGKATIDVAQFKVAKVNMTLAYALDRAAGRISDEEFSRLVHEHFDDFQKLLRELVIDVTWDWREVTLSDVNIKWSLASSLLYSVTLITTIGYGHVAPRTTWGRLMTIMYAIIGIPLTFLYLSNIGNFFASCFRILYKRFCCEILCCQKCERQKKMRREHIRHLRKLQQLAINSIKMRSLGNNYSSAPKTTSNFQATSSDNEGEYQKNGSVPRADGAVVNTGMHDSSDHLDDHQLVPYSKTWSPPYKGHTNISHNTYDSDSDERLSLGLLDVPETDILSESTENLLSFESLQDVRDERKFMSIINLAKETDIVSRSLSNSPTSSPAEIRRQTTTMLLTNGITVTDCSDHPLATSAASLDDVTSGGDSSSPTITAVACIESPKSPDSFSSWHTAMLALPHDPKVSPGSSIRASKASVIVMDDSVQSTGSGSGLNLTMSRSKSVKVSKQDEAKKTRLFLPRSKSHIVDTREDSPASHKSPDENSDASILPPTDLSNKKVTNHHSSPSVSDKKRDASGASRSVIRSKSMDKRESRRSKSPKAKLKSNKSDLANYTANPVVMREAELENTANLSAEQIEHILGQITNKSRRRGRSLKRSKTVRDTTSSAAGAGGNSAAQQHRVMFAKRKSISMTLGDVRDVNQRLGTSGSMQSVTSTRQSDTVTFRNSGFDPDLQAKSKDYHRVNIDEDDLDPTMADYADILNDPSALLGGGTGVGDPYEFEQHEAEESGPISVPISVCMLVMASYIFGGAILFSEWEGWDYLQGSYFCFITLATIGLGDLVPGMAMEKWQSNQKLVLCALWLAVGLSLIAMCFNLMQEEVKEKFRWLGLKLGLLKVDGQ